MIKKNYLLGVIATALVFVSSVICLACSISLYSRVNGPTPVFRNIIAKGTVNQFIQNYSVPVQSNNVLAAAGSDLTFQAKTVYSNYTRANKASVPNLNPTNKQYRFPNVTTFQIDNATSNSQQAPIITTAMTTILSTFNSPNITNLQLQNLNVTSVLAQNMTASSLLAVSQNGTTANLTVEQTALVKVKTLSNIHGNVNQTLATALNSTALSTATNWVNTSKRLSMNGSFAVSNSPIKFTRVSLDCPQIDLLDKNAINFDTINTRVFQLSQVSGTSLGTVIGVNATLNSTATNTMTTQQIQTNKLTAETVNTKLTTVAGTYESQVQVVDSATTAALTVGTAVTINDLEMNIGATTARVVSISNESLKLDMTQDITSSGQLEINAGGSLGLNQTYLKMTQSTATTLDVTNSSSFSTLNTQDLTATQSKITETVSADSLQTKTLETLNQLTSEKYALGSISIDSTTVLDQPVSVLKQGQVNVCDCTQQSVCFQSGALKNDVCQKLLTS